MTDPTVFYVAIAIIAILVGAWQAHRLGRKPPPPTHLDDLNAELRQAQHDHLLEAKRAAASDAMANVYASRIAWLTTEIENEKQRVRPRASSVGRLDVPAATPVADPFSA